ncbi:STAS domain-containing protein [Streptacidiphilus sp. PB12-B1b]|uniref:STAS domain-containing protein n=1 Tax=Streptacidiphilus sp. PB12-B1b TaxID=2705012 RepID=UPI0015FE6F1A|nr:STAS domain-containing protein [Streptacidiphilus sp. PB12-B1b]QMU76784.1 STAS domain-containing protein [Streptacidiphilus sp. PB12-B1b]
MNSQHDEAAGLGAADGLQVGSLEAPDGAVVVWADGDVDLDSSQALRVVLDTALDLGARAVVVDLARTRFFDSVGLNLLLRFTRRAGRAGVPVHLAALGPQVLRIFEITGVDTVLPVHRSVADALAAASSDRADPA